MKLFGISLAILLLFPGTRTSAQAYYFYDDRHYEGAILVELGVQGGIMNALTDIGGKPGAGKKGWKDLNLSFSRPCMTVYTSLIYQQSIGLRIHYCTGSITAADSILKKSRSSVQGRYERNLSFQSPVREFGVGIELSPLALLKITRMDNTPSRISPYVLACIGFFTFNPQAKWEGRWYELQPLHTEGQGFSMYPGRKPYALRQQNKMAGAGLKYEISAWLSGRFEIIHRFLKTDYLDDVSLDSYVLPALFDRELPPAMARLARALADRRAEVDPGHTTNTSYQRGNPSNRDAYFTVEIGLGLVIGRSRR